LGACDVDDDHSDVATRLDDYLWLKLSQVRIDSDNRYSNDFLTYSGFQEQIYTKYGTLGLFNLFAVPLVSMR